MQHVHHGSCGCGDDSRGRLDLYSLNEALTSDQVQCLNEKSPGSGANVICQKWSNRLGVDSSTAPAAASDMDGELIFKVNFGELVSLKGIIIRSQFKSRSPTNIKVFVDPGRELDFGNISDFKPAHVGTSDWDPEANKPILFRSPLFKSFANLYIYIGSPRSTSNDDEERELNYQEWSPEEKKLWDETKNEIIVNYLGLLGAATKTMRVAPKATYEIAPQPGDHPISEITKAGLGFGL